MAKDRDELLYQDVELHSLGRKEYGTLQLTRHHFVFRYYPGGKRLEKPATANTNGVAKHNSDAKAQLLSSESSGITEASTNSASSTAKDGLQSDLRRKERPTEMWVAYPLINYCVLRPSHAVGLPVRVQGTETQVDTTRNDDELFPPTFGTSDYGRPSSDSTRGATYPGSPRSASPAPPIVRDAPTSLTSGRQPAIRLRLKDFRMMALHFRSNQPGTNVDDDARQAFYALRERTCVDNIEDLHAFHFRLPKDEAAISNIEYDSRREYARMGISEKAAEGTGSAWRTTEINRDYSYSATYPGILGVPKSVSDNLLKYGGSFRSKSRIPCLSYLHSNGGSITRSSQPMVGFKGRRNPQDERLVAAIFSSHVPRGEDVDDAEPIDPAMQAATESDPAVAPSSSTQNFPVSQSETALHELPDEKSSSLRKKVYGSTRRNLIADARPKINAIANTASGGGIEDIANYRGSGDVPVEKVFLNIENIHAMRGSLEKVVESFANSDYIKMKPDQTALRKSGWLGHIAALLDGTEMIARIVGLGGSHVLVHCSDGWDRTAQLSALAQVMLDPHSRTLDGFITLVQKEFLSFGHKFRHRNGVEGSEKWFEIENERIAPSRNREKDSQDPSTIGARALTGARNWFERNRGNIFRQQNSSQDNVSENSSSRPPSPPSTLVHSSPTSTSKEEKGHKMSEKEVSPVFHQFLDTVYQLLYQEPKAFEFNERFLRRLFYHSYSCQYGEFLFNCERERSQLKGRYGSVWSHFLSRKQQFINADYIPKIDDPLLFPRRSVAGREVEARWWAELFGRRDEEMNLPRSLTRIPVTENTASLPIAVSFDERTVGVAVEDSTASTMNDGIKVSQSTPNLTLSNEDGVDGVAGLQIDDSSSRASRSTAEGNHADFEIVERQAGPSFDHPDFLNVKRDRNPEKTQGETEYDGDPLGVTASTSTKAPRLKLDFAAFASANAFRER